MATYDRAVFSLRSREEASDVLTSMADALAALSAAATIGEVAAFRPGLLAKYWQLYTIFRESRYRDQTL